jgi:membrane protein DedA with SNARE-associated domain
MLSHLFAAYGMPALFGLVLIEEAGVPLPLPGDTLVMAAGAAARPTIWLLLEVVLVASIAVFVGSSALFALIRWRGKPFLLKYGKWLHLTQTRLERAERWFVVRGRAAMILGRLIPGMRIPTTILAGLSGMSYREYAISASIAALVWSSIYVTLGIIVAVGWTNFVAAVIH